MFIFNLSELLSYKLNSTNWTWAPSIKPAVMSEIQTLFNGLPNNKHIGLIWNNTLISPDDMTSIENLLLSLLNTESETISAAFTVFPIAGQKCQTIEDLPKDSILLSSQNKHEFIKSFLPDKFLDYHEKEPNEENDKIIQSLKKAQKILHGNLTHVIQLESETAIINQDTLVKVINQYPNQKIHLLIDQDDTILDRAQTAKQAPLTRTSPPILNDKVVDALIGISHNKTNITSRIFTARAPENHNSHTPFSIGATLKLLKEKGLVISDVLYTHVQGLSFPLKGVYFKNQVTEITANKSDIFIHIDDDRMQISSMLFAKNKFLKKKYRLHCFYVERQTDICAKAILAKFAHILREKKSITSICPQTLFHRPKNTNTHTPIANPRPRRLFPIPEILEM